MAFLTVFQRGMGEGSEGTMSFVIPALVTPQECILYSVSCVARPE